MINVQCDGCGAELNTPGGLAFSPPRFVNGRQCSDKYHLCIRCWVSFKAFLKGITKVVHGDLDDGA